MRTISLHNIRYELRASGTELWVLLRGREVKLGGIAGSADGRRWELKCRGVKLKSYEDEGAARERLERTARQLGAVVN